MNLKRLRGIATVALITIAAALFAGCSNSMAGSVDGDSNARMATLSISATGIPNDYAEQFAKSYPTAATVASRSITPDTPYTPTDSGLTCYLTGTSETGKKLEGSDAIKVIPTLAGDVYTLAKDGTDTTITLPSMSWNLVLTVYKDDDLTKPVLQGFCSVDLRNGSGTATFKLSPENLPTPGSVKITGKFPTHDNVAAYTMGIYKKTSAGELIKADALTTETVADGTTTETFTYEYDPVDPGSYLYKMIFYGDAGKTIITGSFIDTLVVDAGNALERDLDIIDVVNKKPGAPTNFTASLVDGSETSDGTYQVKLSWESGGGETNFEVELTEYSDGGTTVALDGLKIYGMASMDTETPKTVENFQGSDVWAGKGGAMTYGDTEAYFKLKLGVVYEVRIRARNYVGTSAATSADWTSRTALATAPTGFTPYGSEKINRMRIDYNLNGGTLLYYISGTGYSSKTVNFTEYKTWKGSDLDLLVIDNDNSTTAHNLWKGTSPFSKWLDTTGTGVTKADYKNLSVTADFGSSVTASASMADAKKDVDVADITVKYGSTTITGVAKNTTYEVDKVTAGAVTQLVIQLDMSKDYKNLQFELSYNGTQTMLPIDDTTTNQCTLSLDDYVAGIIQVRVIADTANATGMSQTLTFRLK